MPWYDQKIEDKKSCLTSYHGAQRGIIRCLKAPFIIRSEKIFFQIFRLNSLRNTFLKSLAGRLKTCNRSSACLYFRRSGTWPTSKPSRPTALTIPSVTPWIFPAASTSPNAHTTIIGRRFWEKEAPFSTRSSLQSPSAWNLMPRSSAPTPPWSRQTWLGCPNSNSSPRPSRNS